ncbi:ATP-binding protein [Streptomyces litchfieldiae]|uniref:histidine kinase n=1 Tax=Streptomyces litchfieldiae TaxID=3075543 RepID=A0ABU2MT75_9ACTN|nr:ATP-binding protein [Streptomyces sp. DSM 44938]MDT0344607.1 ATP-binding protein [Streptomyces sp. DSM 44938]
MVHADALHAPGRSGTTGRWLAAPALVAAGAVAAAFLAGGDAWPAVLGTGAVAALAVLALAGETARRGRVIEALREQAEQQADDTAVLVYELMPPLLDQLKRGVVEDHVVPRLAPGPASDVRIHAAHETLVFAIVDMMREKEFQRDSGKRAIVNVANRIQSEIHRLQQHIRSMQFRHDTPKMLGDLMVVEHGINVAGRFATALAVLGGGVPLRRWRVPITLYDVMRAGSGPIAEYTRVTQHHVVETAVVGEAAESLILVMAELLDNATRYSPPTTKVVMNAQEVSGGIEVSIEDCGSGLTDETQRRAEFLLRQGVDGIDLEDLGETARIGLRVAGILASHYGARISLRPSTGAGVRAVVYLPDELFTAVPPPSYPTYAKPSPFVPRPPRPADDEETPVYERAANGLPQRRSRREPDTAPAGQGAVARREAPEESGRRPPGLWVDAFFAGLRAEPSEWPPTATDPPAGDQSRNE